MNIDESAKVLITGANGVLGQNLVRYMNSRGFKNLVLTDLAKSSVVDAVHEYFQADITDNVDAGWFLGVDVVIHCASAAPSYPESMINAIVVDGTKKLLDFAYKAGVNKFIYISSTAVYGIPKSVPVTEDHDLQDYHDPYNMAKIKAESICRDFRNLGMCVPILRPRTFLGPGRLGTFAMLNEWALEGRGFPILGAGKNRYQFLDVEDLCQAIFLSVVASDSRVNDTFNIGAKDYGTILSDYQAVLNEAGHGRKIVCLPKTPALVLLRTLERLKVMPLYKRLYEKMVMDYYVSISKAEEVLGFRPEYSNEQSLTRCFQWYVQNIQDFKGSSGNANSAPWKQGVLGFIKFLF